MQLSPEAMLMAVLASLYLYDSALLLHRNEVLLTHGIRGSWKAIFPFRGGSIFGRELCLPNLLFPARPLFRLHWKMVGVPGSAIGDWVNFATALRDFRFPVFSLFVTLFILLPTALLMRAGDVTTVMLFVLMYLQIAGILLLLWSHRRSLAISSKQFGSMALEFLLCPPFTVNIVRRLSLSQSVSEDFLHAARRLLNSSELRLALLQVMSRLDDEIAAEDENAPRMKDLVVRRSFVEEICPR